MNELLPIMASVTDNNGNWYKIKEKDYHKALDYISRLEEAYFQLKQRDIHDNGPFYHVATVTGMTTPFEYETRLRMARESLEQIKSGE